MIKVKFSSLMLKKAGICLGVILVGASIVTFAGGFKPRIYDDGSGADSSSQQIQGRDSLTLASDKPLPEESQTPVNSVLGESSAQESSPNSKPAPVTTQPSAPAIDETAIYAKLCSDIIKSARELNDGHNKLYLNAWEGWNNNFAGRYDSPEAIESKQFYKEHTKKLFNELVSSTDPGMQKVCHSSTSLADILIQPNYDWW